MMISFIQGIVGLLSRPWKKWVPPAIPALTKLLKDKDDAIRWAASWSLGNIGPEAEAAIPVLTELLRDDNNGLVCKMAREALQKIEHEKNKGSEMPK